MTGVRWKGYIAIARDAERWANHWIDFFYGVKRVADEEVEKFLADEEKKRYSRQSLERLIARGFLDHQDNTYIPTKEGTLFFKRRKILEEVKQRRKKEKIKRDGRYRLVSFDVPGGASSERDTLRRLLAEFGFYPLQKSVWASPDCLPEEFWQLLIDLDLYKYCSVMLAEIVEGAEKLEEYFSERSTGDRQKKRSEGNKKDKA